jgi:cell division protein FtsL
MAEETDPSIIESEESEEIEEQVRVEKTGSNVPFIITLAALTVYFGFQTVQLISERGNLGQVKSSQEAAIQEAQKVQTQFRNLVTKTGQLADQGHAGAKMVMEELQKQGVGFASPPAAPEAKAPPSKEPKPAK